MSNTIAAPDRDPEPGTTPSAQGRNAWRRLIRWATVALAGVVLLALAAWWFLLTQIVPKIDRWREPLVQQASSTLGLPVQIGQISGRADGWWPEVTLEEVRFLDERGRTALRLPRVTARLSPATLWPTSLWRRELHVDRLVLVQPQLEVRRDAQGRLHVAGLALDPSTAGKAGSPAADWVLDQREVRIDQGLITWTDELIKAPPLKLSALNLTLRHRPAVGRRVHDWQFAATPPPAFGQRFTARARVTQPLWSRSTGSSADAWQWLGGPTRASDWRNWSGRANIELPHVDVQQLRQQARLPIEVQGGQGRLSMKMTMSRGALREVGATVNLQGVAVRLRAGLPPLAFRTLAGEISARHESRQSSLAWKGLRFTTDDGLTWPASRARLQWQHAAETGVQAEPWKHTLAGEFETDRLDLALLARLAGRLPLAGQWRAQLANLAPVGVADSLKVSWQGAADAPRRYSAQGNLNGLGWQATGHPGLSGAALRFNATEKGGEATMAIHNGWVEFPGAFEEPRIPLDRMTADVAWRRTPSAQAPHLAAMTVEVSRASFSNSDAQGELRARWQTGKQAGRPYPGQLELSGRLARAEGARVWRYLPAAVHTQARHYVRDAVRGGVGENVTFNVEGDLARFPFPNDAGGKFRIKVPVKNATLDYVPGDKPPPGAVAAAAYWPVFTHLNGSLLFEGQGMRIEGATARLGQLGSGGFQLTRVSGHVPDLAAQRPRLRIQGEGQGPLNDLLRYAAVSPVGEWTGQMLSDARGTGNARLRLLLDIPLTQVEATQLSGDVTMTETDQASLRLSPLAPHLQGVQGQVAFTQDILKVNGTARVWGQNIQIHGSQDAQGTPRFVASGMVSAEGLRNAEWPGLARLAQRLSGQTPVTVSVALNRAKPAGAGGGAFAARPELQITSSLQGLGLDLPAPLHKEAAAAWPLKLVHRREGAQGEADSLQVDLAGGVVVKARYQRSLHAPKPTVRGAVSLNLAGKAPAAELAMPPDGVAAQVSLPELDLDTWQALASSLQSAKPPSAAPSNLPRSMDDYLPDTLSLEVGSLVWHQRALKNVSATLAHPAPDVWRAKIDATQLAGQIEVHPEAATADGTVARRVTARLSRLEVPEAEAEAFQTQAAQQMLGSQTTSVPALDIVVDQFEWRGLPLGKLEIEAVNRGGEQGAALLPEWRLTKFRLGNADAQLSAVGNWAAVADAPGSHRAAFTFSLDLNNSGQLLSRLGLPQTLRGGKGQMAGQVSWLGSPLEPHVASLTGDVNVSIDQGQFLKVEPGAAKLLGVLSLQSLPRRLALDFRDVFQSGFAFDRIEGDVSIKQGVASTRNLRMRGVQAVVLMEGQADLAQETQQLRVFVVPEVNAGTASLAYAAINPAVGLGTFIAQVLLRKAVVDAATREFLVTGSWADPQVERVKRSSVPAAANTESNTEPSPVTAPRTPS